MKKTIAGLFLAILLLLLGNGVFGVNLIVNRSEAIPSNSKIAAPSDRIVGVLAMTKGNNNILNSFFSIKTAQAASLADKINPNYKYPDSEKDKAGQSKWVFDVWDFCLSLVNIVLIGVLIFLGVVNVLHLNYDTYQLKKILLPLVMAVILANLSLFICRGIVEFSNALSNTFFQDQEQISQGIVNGLHLDKIATVGAGVGITLLVVSWIPVIGQMVGIAGILVPLLIGLIIGLIIFLAFAILAGIMYVRQFIIMILAAVSPLAFIFMVLPATQGLFRKWWDWFLRWVFMGPIILLILKVASIIGNSSGGELNFFAFIAIIGLMVAAIMAPWLLAGSIMGKLQSGLMKGGGWAGKNVPGIREATAFGKGIYDKRKEDQEKHLAKFSAGGRGLMLGVQGKGGVREEWNLEKDRQEGEGYNKMFDVNRNVGDLDEKVMLRMQLKDPNAIKQLSRIAGQRGELNNALVVKFKNVAKASGLKEGSTKYNELLGHISRSADYQKQVYGKTREHPSQNHFLTGTDLKSAGTGTENNIDSNLKSYTDAQDKDKKPAAEKLVNQLEDMSNQAKKTGYNKEGDQIRKKIREIINSIEAKPQSNADLEKYEKFRNVKKTHGNENDFNNIKASMGTIPTKHVNPLLELSKNDYGAGGLTPDHKEALKYVQTKGINMNQIFDQTKISPEQIGEAKARFQRNNEIAEQIKTAEDKARKLTNMRFKGTAPGGGSAFG